MSVLPELSNEEKGLLMPLARAVASDFLNIELKTVEDRLSKFTNSASENLSNQPGTVNGNGEIVKLYEQKKAIIQDLMNASTFEPLPFLLRDRLKKLQDAMSQSERTNSNAKRDKSWQIHREHEILTELTQNWVAWLKQNQPKL